MNKQELVSKLTDVGLTTKWHTAFYMNNEHREFFVLNPQILPKELRETDVSILELFYRHRQNLNTTSRQALSCITARLNSVENHGPAMFSLEYARSRYTFIVYTQLCSDGTTENLGYIYKNTDMFTYLECTQANFSMAVSISRFNEYVTNTLQNSGDKHYAMVTFDIQGFSSLNSKYGESICDEMLFSIMQRLHVLSDDIRKFARQSADIFSIFLEYGDPVSLRKKLTIWDAALNTYADIKYRLAWGVYMITDPAEPMRAMLDEAGKARMFAKADVLDNICILTEAQVSELAKENWIERHMLKALQNHEFKIWIQPKFDTRTNKVVGGECLTRWVTPGGTILSPVEYIPVFERNGFVIQLDRYVWEETCKLIAQWGDEVPRVPLSVNVSRKNFEDAGLVDFLKSLVQKYNIPEGSLELEITESAHCVFDTATIEKLKEVGFKILMDDFGAGYSSLNILKSTNFDVIKLDRGFFEDFLQDESGKKILQHTIAMIKSINLGVVAEGVETVDQVTFLQENGCNIVQGYLYSKPVPIEVYHDMLDSNGGKDAEGV